MHEPHGLTTHYIHGENFIFKKTRNLTTAQFSFLTISADMKGTRIKCRMQYPPNMPSSIHHSLLAYKLVWHCSLRSFKRNSVLKFFSKKHYGWAASDVKMREWRKQKSKKHYPTLSPDGFANNMFGVVQSLTDPIGTDFGETKESCEYIQPKNIDNVRKSCELWRIERDTLRKLRRDSRHARSILSSLISEIRSMENCL